MATGSIAYPQETEAAARSMARNMFDLFDFFSISLPFRTDCISPLLRAAYFITYTAGIAGRLPKDYNPAMLRKKKNSGFFKNLT
jgi:hypothetical protein